MEVRGWLFESKVSAVKMQIVYERNYKIIKLHQKGLLAFSLGEQGDLIY